MLASTSSKSMCLALLQSPKCTACFVLTRSAFLLNGGWNPARLLFFECFSHLSKRNTKERNAQAGKNLLASIKRRSQRAVSLPHQEAEEYKCGHGGSNPPASFWQQAAPVYYLVAGMTKIFSNLGFDGTSGCGEFVCVLYRLGMKLP